MQIANTEVFVNENGLYSLMDLHKASGGENAKRPSIFFNNKSTASLVAILEKRHGKDAVMQSSNGGKNTGYMACKQLMVAYAMWLSPEFYDKVIQTFIHIAEGNETAALQTAGTTASLSRLKVLTAEYTALKGCAHVGYQDAAAIAAIERVADMTDEEVAANKRTMEYTIERERKLVAMFKSISRKYKADEDKIYHVSCTPEFCDVPTAALFAALEKSKH